MENFYVIRWQTADIVYGRIALKKDSELSVATKNRFKCYRLRNPSNLLVESLKVAELICYFLRKLPLTILNHSLRGKYSSGMLVHVNGEETLRKLKDKVKTFNLDNPSRLVDYSRNQGRRTVTKPKYRKNELLLLSSLNSSHISESKLPEEVYAYVFGQPRPDAFFFPAFTNSLCDEINKIPGTILERRDSLSRF